MLDDTVFVICANSSTIKTYKADTLSPLAKDIHVVGMKDPCDIVACRHDRQLYVAEYNYCIWRVSADDHQYVKWLTIESAAGTFHACTLSVTWCHLLVTSVESCTLHQYWTTEQQLLSMVHLPRYMVVLLHAVETSRDTFVVGHRGTSQDKWQCSVSIRCFL